MRHLKVWIKLGIGFGIVLSIMCVLGIQAIRELDIQHKAAETIADAYMPELTMSVRFERAAQSAAQAVLRFVSTGEERFYGEALKQMNELSKVASEAADLVKKYPFLSALADNLQEADRGFKAYSQYAEQTHSLVLKLNSRQDNLQKSAGEFFDTLNETLALAENYLETAITDMRPQNEVMTRAKMVYRFNKAIDLGNELQTANARAQLQGDPDLTLKALEIFTQLNTVFEEIQANALPQNTARVQKILAAANAYKTDMRAMVDEWKELKRISVERTMHMEKLLSNAQNTASTGIKRVQELCEIAKVETLASIDLLTWGLCLGVFIGLFFSWLLTRKITKPLEKSVDFAENVANGNLSERLDIEQRDEIGKLAVALNSMVQNLTTRIRMADDATNDANLRKEEATAAMRQAEEARNMAENAKRQGMLDAANQLESIVVNVSSASVQLSAQVEQASRGAKQQAMRVSDTASSMEEMNSSVVSVAQSSSATADVSNQAKNKAVMGAEAVHKVVSGMDRINQGAVELRHDMEELSTKAESIGNILNVISDIADQTNLLALNAAIEAARAGEAGRGFAVVADEVRKLAEKTMQATSEVGNAIRGIQEGTAMNMAKVENTVGIVNEVTALASSSGEALTEIVSLVEQASEQIRGIAAASEQQSATSDNISRSAFEVNRIASETAITMEESGRAVNDLSRQAQMLSQLIETMKRG